MDVNQEALELLAKNAFKKGEFTLSSGKRSDKYLDCRGISMTYEGAQAFATLLAARIPSNIEAVGGMGHGADPLIYALRDFYKTPIFAVRKLVKVYGTKRGIEGMTKPRMKVIVVDDVLSSGGSMEYAIKQCMREDFDILKGLVLIDREEGGKERVWESCGIPVDAVFTLTQIEECSKALWGQAQSEEGAVPF